MSIQAKISVKRYAVRTALAAILISMMATIAPVTDASATDYRVRSWAVGGAQVELWYSTSGWNWVVVKGATNRGAEAGIYSANSGWRWTVSYAKAPYQFSTGAVYAPGNTCVNVVANVQSYWWPYGIQRLNTRVC